MLAYLLLVAAGSFWICGIAGACLWWNLRRAARRLVAQQEMRPGGNGKSGGARIPDCDAAVVPQAPVLDPLEQILRCLPDSADDGTVDAQGPVSRTMPLRFPYRLRQWAAPCDRDRLPDTVDFYSVECRELFSDGVSFYSDSMCPTETLVITLGTHDRVVFMLARVTSEVSQSADSRARYLVECQFIRRIRENTGRWARALRSAQAVSVLQSASGAG